MDKAFNRNLLKKKNDDDFTFGVTDHPTQSIVLDGALGLELQAETMLHELLHCCMFALGSPDWTSEDDLEERICMSLSPILYDTLRSNPDLVRYLFEAGD